MMQKLSCFLTEISKVVGDMLHNFEQDKNITNIMKKLTAYLLIICTFLLVTVSAVAQTGVWKYEWAGWEGIAILSPTHFIWLLSTESRQNFTNANPSVVEKAKAFEALIAEAGTWELVTGTRAKATKLFSINPQTLKTPTVWDFERDGDYLVAWIIQADGSRSTTPIKSRKLADWGAPSEVNQFNGVWEYVGQNGLYLQAGSYGGWILVNGPQTDTSTEEGKAKNFDVTNCSVAVGTHLGGQRHIWNLIHSWDVRHEKTAFFTNCEFAGPDLFNMWAMDARGKQVGEKWQVRRVGR